MTTGLAEAFLEERALPYPPRVELEALLASVAAAGKSAWPNLAYSEHDFVRDLSRKVPAAGNVVATLSALRAPDLFLACACARGVERALAAFEDRYLRALPRALGKEKDLDDLVQELRLKLLLGGPDHRPEITDYSGRGSLAGWLRVMAVHALQKRRRRAMAQERTSEAAVEDVIADPQLEFLKRHDRPRFQQAFRAALAALPLRERTLLRLHYAEGLSAEQLGAIYGVHRASSTRWLAQARQLLLHELRRRLAESLRIDRREASSLVRLLSSQLEISLRQALGG